MEKNSPFYLFHPDSIGWLHRRHVHRHKRVAEIFASDIARLLKVDPANRSDTVLQHYNLLALEGRLPRRRGRKPLGSLHRAKLVLIEEEIDKRTARLKSAIRNGKVKRSRGDVEPRIQAADEAARRWKLGSGRTLLNQISSLKSRHYYCD